MIVDPTFRVDVRAPALGALRRCALFGDEIAFGGGGLRWLRPEDAFSFRDGQLERHYVSERGDYITLDWGPQTEDFVDVVLEAAGAASLAAVRVKWTAFLQRIGKSVSLDPKAFGWVEILLTPTCPFTAARRPAHPDPVVDRLMMSDRAFEAARVDALLEGPSL